MLFVYPLLILCFNIININCDVHNTNLERLSRRNIVSRDIRHSNVSDQLDNISASKVALESQIPKTDDVAIKRIVTRVRKQKRRRLPLSLYKTVEVVGEYTTPKSKNTEENIKVTESPTRNVNVDQVVKINNKDLGVQKEENSNNDKNIETTLEQITAKVDDKIVEEKVFSEKTESSKSNVSAPRTFPKRPAEFNPVFKKKRTRERDPVVRIINEKNFVYGHNGNFHYSFEGGDGTKVYSKGKLITHQEEKAGEGVVGGYFYKDAQGNDYSLTYTADQNGYRPVGAHLPTPPPIPPAIARALEYLATKSTPEPVTEEYSAY